MAIGTDVGGSLGTVLLGVTAAAALSGIVGALTYLFFRLYPHDPTKIKLLVAWLWLLDTIHTCLLCWSNWWNLITHYGDMRMLDFIPTTTALAILYTCLSSFTVHCYYTRMLYRFSGRRWYLSAPLIFLATIRLGLGINSTVRCITLRSWETFIRRFEWSITAAYCISAAIDILISMSLSYFLHKQKRRTDIAAASQILDTITTYTVNSGTLTCVFALMSLISWFAFRGTLVFLGTHFLIGKLYTCAVLTTLLMRRFLRERYSKTLSTGLRVRVPKFPQNYSFSTPKSPLSSDSTANSELVLTPPNSARLTPQKSSKVSFEPLKFKLDVDPVTISYGQSSYEPTETMLTNCAVTDTVDIEARTMI